MHVPSCSHLTKRNPGYATPVLPLPRKSTKKEIKNLEAFLVAVFIVVLSASVSDNQQQEY